MAMTAPMSSPVGSPVGSPSVDGDTAPRRPVRTRTGATSGRSRSPAWRRPIRVKIASERDEFEQAFRLVADRYKARGYDGRRRGRVPVHPAPRPAGDGDLRGQGGRPGRRDALAGRPTTRRSACRWRASTARRSTRLRRRGPDAGRGHLPGRGGAQPARVPPGLLGPDPADVPVPRPPRRRHLGDHGQPPAPVAIIARCSGSCRWARAGRTRRWATTRPRRSTSTSTRCGRASRRSTEEIFGEVAALAGRDGRRRGPPTTPCISARGRSQADYRTILKVLAAGGRPAAPDAGRRRAGPAGRRPGRRPDHVAPGVQGDARRSRPAADLAAGGHVLGRPGQPPGGAPAGDDPEGEPAGRLRQGRHLGRPPAHEQRRHGDVHPRALGQPDPGAGGGRAGRALRRHVRPDDDARRPVRERRRDRQRGGDAAGQRLGDGRRRPLRGPLARRHPRRRPRRRPARRLQGRRRPRDQRPPGQGRGDDQRDRQLHDQPLRLHDAGPGARPLRPGFGVSDGQVLLLPGQGPARDRPEGPLRADPGAGPRAGRLRPRHV